MSCFFSEFLAIVVLIIVIHAMNDKRNTPPPAGLAPLVLFFLILGIGASLGMKTGALFMLLVILFLICCRLRYQPCSWSWPSYADCYGWLWKNGIHLPEVSRACSYNWTEFDDLSISQYWIWCPVMAPFLGAQVGTILYDLFLYKGPDNVFGWSGSHKRISPA